MAGRKLKVIYEDKREVKITTTPRAEVMAEQYTVGLKSENAILFTYYLAWAVLNRSGQEASGFDAWLDLIADVVDDDEESADEAGPTELVPSADSSSS